MQRNNDNIQFESRREIETLMLILMEWQKEHPADEKFDFSRELSDKLDIMHMCW